MKCPPRPGSALSKPSGDDHQKTATSFAGSGHASGKGVWWVDVKGKEERLGTSICNEAEAAAVTDLCCKIREEDSWVNHKHKRVLRCEGANGLIANPQEVSFPGGNLKYET